jgi:hypothetical protein
MRLTVFDEYPFHQHPTPFHVPGTSDVHFNDGYFCATFTHDCYLVCGVRLHPNMNVIDGFAGLAHGGEQRVVRASRALRPNAGELAVGPLRIDVHEPLRRVRMSLAQSDAGFGFDLAWEARGEPFLEAPYRFSKYGHLTYDMIRYTQVCRTRGTVRIDGEARTVDGWDAIRDHSWGVRDGMGPATRHGGVEREPEEIDHRRFRIWTQFATDRYVGYVNTHEDENGRTLDFEGRLDFADGSSLKLAALRHAIVYAAGTKHPVSARLELLDATGRWRALQLRSSGTPADVQGLGYYGGWRDGGSAGCWRGVGPVVETDRYPSRIGLASSGLDRVAPDRRMGPTEFACLLEGDDGERGMAHFEHHLFGAYRPYGFDRA